MWIPVGIAERCWRRRKLREKACSHSLVRNNVSRLSVWKHLVHKDTVGEVALTKNSQTNNDRNPWNAWSSENGNRNFCCLFNVCNICGQSLFYWREMKWTCFFLYTKAFFQLIFVISFSTDESTQKYPLSASNAAASHRSVARGRTPVGHWRTVFFCLGATKSMSFSIASQTLLVNLLRKLLIPAKKDLHPQRFAVGIKDLRDIEDFHPTWDGFSFAKKGWFLLSPAIVI